MNNIKFDRDELDKLTRQRMAEINEESGYRPYFEMPEMVEIVASVIEDKLNASNIKSTKPTKPLEIVTPEQKQKIKDLAFKVRKMLRELDAEFNALAAEFDLEEGNEMATHFAIDWLHDAVYNCNNETIEYSIDNFEKALNKRRDKDGDV